MFSNPIVAGTKLVRSAIESPNYSPGSTGWAVNRDGTAEFSDATVRGGVSAGPTSTRVVIGAGADLPPPLNTYLVAGIVWVTDTTMSYVGIINDAFYGYITEQGFVLSDDTIEPNTQWIQNGPGTEYRFIGISDAKFYNTGGTYFLPGDQDVVPFTPMRIGNAINLKFDSDVYTTWEGGAPTGVTPTAWILRDSENKLDTYENWDVVFDAASSLEVENLRQASSGTITGDFSFTSTAYTTAVTLGTYADCALTFVAPPSGRVSFFIRSQLLNSVNTNITYLSPETREGATIGAGTIVQAANDSRAAASGFTSANPGQTFVSAFAMVTGLTPGATYNTRLLHRVNAGTGRTLLRQLIMIPSP